LFASIPTGPTNGAKDTFPNGIAMYGGILVGLFNFASDPDTGAIFLVSTDGQTVEPIATGLNGIQMITMGPGGAFGNEVFVASEGRDFPELEIGDGAVYTLSPNGALTEFMTNLDASSVVFDVDRVLGGGMFVSDIVDDPNVASKIWRVRVRGCYADFNRDGVVDTRDVLAFLNAWASMDSESDCDRNGVIDTRDVLCFLNAWNTGC
jgi:hypothetical protein